MRSWRFADVFLVLGSVLMLVAVGMALVVIPSQQQAAAAPPRPIFAPAGTLMVHNGTIPPLPKLDTQLINEGKSLYQQHCAECHGANLEGQPNWQSTPTSGKLLAPPQDDTGPTWQISDARVYKSIFEGSANGEMPSFRDKLSGRDAVAILSYIKSRWSYANRLYQWQMTMLQH
jgi:mono/diheme cytochrome c family protein